MKFLRLNKKIHKKDLITKRRKQEIWERKSISYSCEDEEKEMIVSDSDDSIR